MVDHVSHRIEAWEYDIRDQHHRFSGKGTIKNIRANICHNTSGTAHRTFIVLFTMDDPGSAVRLGSRMDTFLLQEDPSQKN